MSPLEHNSLSSRLTMNEQGPRTAAQPSRKHGQLCRQRLQRDTHWPSNGILNWVEVCVTCKYITYAVNIIRSRLHAQWRLSSRFSNKINKLDICLLGMKGQCTKQLKFLGFFLILVKVTWRFHAWGNQFQPTMDVNNVCFKWLFLLW